MTPFHRCLSAACHCLVLSLSTCPLLLSPRPRQADSGLTHPASSSSVAKKKKVDLAARLFVIVYLISPFGKKKTTRSKQSPGPISRRLPLLPFPSRIPRNLKTSPSVMPDRPTTREIPISPCSTSISMPRYTTMSRTENNMNLIQVELQLHASPLSSSPSPAAINPSWQSHPRAAPSIPPSSIHLG